MTVVPNILTTIIVFPQTLSLSLSLFLIKGQDARSQGPQRVTMGWCVERTLLIGSRFRTKSQLMKTKGKFKFLSIFRSLEIRHNSIPLNHWYIDFDLINSCFVFNVWITSTLRSREEVPRIIVASSWGCRSFVHEKTQGWHSCKIHHVAN